MDDGASCPGTGGPENIYWPVGLAPTGVYKVKLVYYKPCAGSGPTQYNVSVTVDGKVSTFSGTIKPHHSGGNPVQITTFKR